MYQSMYKLDTYGQVKTLYLCMYEVYVNDLGVTEDAVGTEFSTAPRTEILPTRTIHIIMYYVPKYKVHLAYIIPNHPTKGRKNVQRHN